MILITGGAFQGKLEAAEQIYKIQNPGKQPVVAEGERAETGELHKADIICHFHLWLKRMLQEGKDPYPMAETLLKGNPDVILVMNQLGCGIVPMDRFDREYRELTGRMGCVLARQAEDVYLVNCGIAKRLKQEPGRS